MQPETRIVVISSILLLSVPAMSAGAADAPRPVSPGGTEGMKLIAERCPTFNWAGLAGAEAYELVVYRVSNETRREEKPLVHETLPGAASGWTPSLDRCLEAGGSYAWSLRAVSAKRTSEWSRPSLFAIAGGRVGARAGRGTATRGAPYRRLRTLLPQQFPAPR